MHAERPNVLLLATWAGRDKTSRLQSLARRLEDERLTATLLLAGHRSPDAPLFLRQLAPIWTSRRLARQISPQTALIHALDLDSAPIALELAERRSIPYLLTIDDFLPANSSLRVSAQWCRGIITHDEDVAHDLIVCMQLPRDRVVVIPWGIERIAATAEPRVSSGQVPVVGAVTPLASGSGAATFLQAALRVASEINEVEFIVVGTGSAEGDHRRFATRLGIADRVTFVDDVGNAPAFWDLLHVFCDPAVGPSEGSTLATAMAHGVPSVASAVPGLRSWVEHGRSGVLVPPNNAEALAGAIAQLLRSPERARAYGECGRNRVAQLADPEREVNSLQRLYAEAFPILH
jgi:glycosyltransferase involved in cell wall biosynthesis